MKLERKQVIAMIADWLNENQSRFSHDKMINAEQLLSKLEPIIYEELALEQARGEKLVGFLKELEKSLGNRGFNNYRLAEADQINEFLAVYEAKEKK